LKIGLYAVSYSGTWGGQTALTLKEFIERAYNLGFKSMEFAAKNC
jgi:hypothetical protein